MVLESKKGEKNGFSGNLFNEEETKGKNSANTCRECEHRERWQFNNTVIQYCGIRKSNRTDNGLLKIKAKNVACEVFLKEK